MLDGIFPGEISQLPANCPVKLFSQQKSHPNVHTPKTNGSAIQGGEEECGELGWLVVVEGGVEKGHLDQQTNCNQPASTTHGKKKTVYSLIGGGFSRQ